jgi:hypothetical protein
LLPVLETHLRVRYSSVEWGKHISSELLPVLEIHTAEQVQQ